MCLPQKFAWKPPYLLNLSLFNSSEGLRGRGDSRTLMLEMKSARVVFGFFVVSYFACEWVVTDSPARIYFGCKLLNSQDIFSKKGTPLYFPRCPRHGKYIKHPPPSPHPKKQIAGNSIFPWLSCDTNPSAASLYSRRQREVRWIEKEPSRDFDWRKKVAALHVACFYRIVFVKYVVAMRLLACQVIQCTIIYCTSYVIRHCI